MKFNSKITRSLGLTLATLGAWALLAGSACERKGEQSAAKVDARAQEKQADSAPAPLADTHGKLPGEAAPGTIQPQSPGPEAPAVFFLSGLKGYLEPCGCSAEILLGGIERITGYVDAARKLYPATTMLDGGDMLFEFAKIGEHEVAQVKAKAEVIVAAQKRLQTQVTVPGELDFVLGPAYYLEKIKEAGVQPIAANLKIDGATLDAGRILQVGGIKLGVVGAADPALYEGLQGVEATAPVEPVRAASQALKAQGATTLILVMHGDLVATRQVLDAVDGFDFAVIGHAPRETDEVNEANGAFTLEAFDQGRYLGVLKLYERDDASPYANAGAASKSEVEKLERLIAHKRDQIERFPPSKRHENPPIIQRLRADMTDLEAQVERLRATSVDVPPTGNAFIYRPVAMQPGLPINEPMEKQREAFNQSLKSLQMQVTREVVPPEEGQPFYIGTNNCATCHVSEHEFWQKTAHARAVQTLEERDKLFDQTCISCHVVGYEKPGGSVMGTLRYEAKLGERTIEKDLENVGCESCHGPGSQHAQLPVDPSGVPQFIHRQPAVNDCMQCHVAEHSPKFNFEAYVRDITGPGHERRAK